METNTQASTATKGEYQPFDADRQFHIGPLGRFTFLSPLVQNLKILLKRDTKIAIGTDVIKTPLVEAQFRDFRFDTDSESISDMIRSTRAFKCGQIKELVAMKEDRKQSEIKKLQEQLMRDPEIAKEVLSGLRPGRLSSPASEAVGASK